ncbi:MAG: hypothetical protein K2X81_11870, partial [Candidatus Obscuribacterales bacterium]|nr:hypothetical protein [Candidatus Obscuribacterales bacterium]
KEAISIWQNTEDAAQLSSRYECTKSLAKLYVETQKWVLAEPLLMECLSQNQKISKSVDDDFELLIATAKVKYGQGDKAAAASMLRSAISIMHVLQNPQVIAITDLAWMAECLKSLGMDMELDRLVDSQIQLRAQNNLPVEDQLKQL